MSNIRPLHPGQALPYESAAIVHDWLPVYAGAERVLEQMLEVLPDARLYSLIEFLSEEDRQFLDGRDVETSFIQRLPFSKSKYRSYLPLTPLAIEQFDLTEHDLVVSSSYVVAKAALTRADQFHISYVHSPIRYAWDLYFEYLESGGYKRGIKSGIARLILHYMRTYDVSTANRVDSFVANSKYVAKRIRKTYRRDARVVYPPVDTDRFRLNENKDDYYLTVSRLVPYKRIDLIVSAFAHLPDKRLVVVGDGPQMNAIKAKATQNVELLGFQSNDTVRTLMENAKAFVFAAEEDFGIVPVEAQACGTPVLAYGRGGALETVVPGETGMFFGSQSEEEIIECVGNFERLYDSFSPDAIRRHSERFSKQRFIAEFQNVIAEEYAKFRLDD